MKTTMNQFFKIFLLVCVVGFTSCGGNDDEVVEQDEVTELTKEFQGKVNQMSVPSSMKNSSNAKAQEAYAHFSTAKTLGESFSALLTVPPGATQSFVSNEGLAGKGVSAKNTKTYTWSSNGTTVTYTVTESSDRYTFEYSIEGGALSGKVMDGYQLKDGSYAEFRMYSDNVVISTFKFWIDGDNVTAKAETQGLTFTLEANISDNSGNIKMYVQGNLSEEYNWESDGSGWHKDHRTNVTTTW